MQRLLQIVELLAHLKHTDAVIVCRSVCRPLRGDTLIWSYSRDFFSTRRRTSLMFAASTGDVNRLLYLLKMRPNVDFACDLRNTALMWAILNAQPVCVDYLLRFGANPYISSNDALTPLLAAIRLGNIDIVRLLCRGLAKISYDINCQEFLPLESYIGCLNQSIRLGHTEITDLLLASGARPDNHNAKTKNFRYMTSLMWAIKRMCSIDIIKQIIEPNDVEYFLPDNTTAFLYAAKCGNTKALAYIIHYYTLVCGFTLDQFDTANMEDHDAVMICANASKNNKSTKHLNCLMVLINNGFDLNYTRNNINALRLALIKNNSDIVWALCQAGCKVSEYELDFIDTRCKRKHKMALSKIIAHHMMP